MGQGRRRQQRGRVIILALTVIAVIFGIATMIPPSQRNMKPHRAESVLQGVPLDPRSPWPKFRANAQQTGRSTVMPQMTGRQPWVFRTGRGVFSSPVIDGAGTVYVGSADHHFYALDRTGALRWKVATAGVIDSSALLDDQNRVYFGSGDAHIYAVNRETGEVLWKTRAHTVDEVRSEYGLKTYNVDWFEGNIAMLPDGRLLAPNDNYLLYVLDRDTGHRERVLVSNEMIWSSPAVNAVTGRFFFGSQFIALRNVFAWDAASGKRLWASGGLGSNAASPLLTSNDPRGALVVGGYDGYVRAYAQDNGKKLWSFGTRDHIYASPAQLQDGTLIQASADGTVYALNPDDGTVVWAFDTLEPLRSSPAIDGAGTIYVGSGEGKLFALNSDGTLRWSYQCITEIRNDLNASPAIGPEGVAVAGESGEVFFVPFDYPLTSAGRADPRAFSDVGETLPKDGASLVWTGPFGKLSLDPPSTLEAHAPLTFSLWVRNRGDTVQSALVAKSFDVSWGGAYASPSPPRVEVAANGRFVTLIPQETWTSPEGGTLTLRMRSRYVTEQRRLGLKFFGGRDGGVVDSQVEFQVQPRSEATMPYQAPREPGAAGTVFELRRLAVPNPTMLPSWNQIGFDSLHYLAGLVESTQSGGVLWVVPGRYDERTGRTVVAPDLKDRFVLNIDHHGGLLTLSNYRPFKLTFVGSWDMPFGAYRVATRAPTTGDSAYQPAALTALVLGDELEFYGTFLKIMGLTHFWTGHMPVYGGMDVGLWQGQPEFDATQVGTGIFSLHDNVARVKLQGGRLKLGEHVFGLLLVDGASGAPVRAGYARDMNIVVDADGCVEEVAVPLLESSPATMRAYYMVDTYPALRGAIQGNAAP